MILNWNKRPHCEGKSLKMTCILELSPYLPMMLSPSWSCLPTKPTHHWTPQLCFSTYDHYGSKKLNLIQVDSTSILGNGMHPISKQYMYMVNITVYNYAQYRQYTYIYIHKAITNISIHNKVVNRYIYIINIVPRRASTRVPAPYHLQSKQWPQARHFGRRTPGELPMKNQGIPDRFPWGGRAGWPIYLRKLGPSFGEVKCR